MSTVILTVGPGQSLRDVARLMAERNVGAAVVIDPDASGPGIITERDVIRALADAEDMGVETVADHLTERVVYAAPDWSLERAADEMIKGNFRHLIVIDGGDCTGILSMRDIVNCWVGDGATCDI